MVDKSLPDWQVLNTVAHIAGYFGNYLADGLEAEFIVILLSPGAYRT